MGWSDRDRNNEESLCVRKRDREAQANTEYFPQIKIILFNKILNN